MDDSSLLLLNSITLPLLFFVADGTSVPLSLRMSSASNSQNQKVEWWLPTAGRRVGKEEILMSGIKFPLSKINKL